MNALRALFNFIRPLIAEDKGMSLGRIAFWATLIPAVHVWWGGADILIHHLYVLGFLLIYNSYKRMDMFIGLIKAWKGSDGD